MPRCKRRRGLFRSCSVDVNLVVITSLQEKLIVGFIEISWAQALSEIGEKMRSIIDTHGPQSFAIIGAGGQGSHFDAAFATALLRGIGSRFHYSSIAQELTGYFWCSGRLFGRQNIFPIPDEHHADMILAIGWNGMVKYKSLTPLAILSPQVAHAELLFAGVLENPSGLWVGKIDGDNMSQLQTKDQKINMYIPEMAEWLTEITPEAAEKDLAPDPAYPFILNAGRHKPENANNLMRKPDWNKGRRTSTLAMNPEDDGRLGAINVSSTRSCWCPAFGAVPQFSALHQRAYRKVGRNSPLSAELRSTLAAFNPS